MSNQDKGNLSKQSPGSHQQQGHKQANQDQNRDQNRSAPGQQNQNRSEQDRS